MLGGIVGCMLSCTTFLYLNHDREHKEWRGGHNSTRQQQQRSGMWPPSTADFNWCEPDYVYTPAIVELWNSLTSLCFLIGPVVTWRSADNWEVKLNLLLVAGIGLGSAAFHATLQYEAQLLDELPMICYVAHTTALLARRDVSCPVSLKAAMAALCVLLFGTAREALAHKVGRVVMVLSFSGCFVWLAFSLAALVVELDGRSGTGDIATRRYQQASLTVVIAIVAWVADNLGCNTLHSLPFGLPYPQLHATLWHTGMAFVCHCLCTAVLMKHEQYAAERTQAKGE